MPSLPLTHTLHTAYRPTGNKLGFPAQRQTKMVYAESLTLNGASGIAETYQWRLNSLFDPDYTSTGHQPLGYDEWAKFFNHYVVKKVSWEIQVVGTTSNVPVLLSTLVSDDVTAPTSASLIAENGGDVRLANGYVGEQVVVFQGGLDIASYFRRDEKSLTSDSELRATVSSNPSETVFLNFTAVSPSSGSHTTSVFIRLVFDAVFMEPSDLAAS